jgi:hypothetical protein
LSTINIYCDESCHLEHDRQDVMVLGAVWCPSEKAEQISVRLREVKVRHGLGADFEVKWTKVSPGKQAFYLDLVDYFFDDDDLHFRAVIIVGKSRLQHDAFAQDHDSWYYKMYFDLLKALLSPVETYVIYLDAKDTRSAEKLRKLHEVLCNNMYDFQRRIISRVQTVRSHDVEQIQLADLLIGAVGYANRGMGENAAKRALVQRIKQRSGYSLDRTTLLREEKVNLLRWEPSETRA